MHARVSVAASGMHAQPNIGAVDTTETSPAADGDSEGSRRTKEQQSAAEEAGLPSAEASSAGGSRCSRLSLC